MSFDPASIKQHIAQNRAKSLILAALTLLMAALFVRAFVLTAPRHASAMPLPLNATPATPLVDPKAQADLEQRVQESRELWQALNDNHGMAAEHVCRFDTQFYHLDPARQEAIERAQAAAEPAPPQGTVAPVTVHPAPLDATPHLTLQFTMLGADPSALINSRVVHIGDVIEGYRVVQIQAVSVTLEKDGTKYPLNMAKPDPLAGDGPNH